jgi:hypothetical protein
LSSSIDHTHRKCRTKEDNKKSLGLKSFLEKDPNPAFLRIRIRILFQIQFQIQGFDV